MRMIRSKWIEVFDLKRENIDSINVDKDFDETDIREIQRLLGSYDWPHSQPAYVQFYVFDEVKEYTTEVIAL